MLDVPPPHPPTHTWRDFFIHIATIVIGLLIAIGLEQTVEYIHHRHQAHQLEEDMRAESEQNIQIFQADLASSETINPWVASYIKAAQSAPEKGGFVSFTIPPPPEVHNSSAVSTVPSHGVWTVARAEGTVNLLPPMRAQMYDRLDFEASEALRLVSAYDIARTEELGVDRAIGADYEPGKAIRITPLQRDEFVKSESKVFELSVWLETRLALWQGACQAILDPHVSTMNEMFPYIDRAAAKVHEP
jgi:hypothetical protein